MSQPPAPATPPVALVCFNRPDLVTRVLDAVRAAAPADLFVIGDGPRPDRPDDAARCADVRRVVAEQVDWPCTVHTRWSETNLGCEQNVERGLDWVFGQVPAAVVLEDDCVPDPSFFPYAAELLDRYADDERFMMVSGTLFEVDPESFGDASYGLTTFSITWGWATWARAWQRHRAMFPRDWQTLRPGQADPGAPLRVASTEPAPGALATRAAGRYFAEVARSRGQEFGWDSHWFLSQVVCGALAVAPATNVVHNAGFGDEATHTQSERVMPAAEPITFPLRHPAVVERDVALQRGLELGLVRTNGRLARTVRRLVPQGRLRTVLRAVAGRVITSRSRAR
ncbi:glycosyltransferase [Nocardioides sp. SYSU D00038]|uniref:glycosyltransferase n=1 Tax=Nocardioides sp. SYSU D00038 TaxID=2812554 RepID=UPI001967C15B|nr:glycosyltransferase [Nocardioides sp. SYSU D00038]